MRSLPASQKKGGLSAAPDYSHSCLDGGSGGSALSPWNSVKWTTQPYEEEIILGFSTGQPEEGYYVTAPEDDYDVLIEDDLNNDEIKLCHLYETKILSRVLPQLYATVFLAGLLGSLLVVLILVKHKGLKHMGNIYFLNLAVSNLCFLLALPFWAYAAMHEEVLGNSMCKILVVLYSIGLYSEALFNILLTVQRYLVFINVNFPSTTRAVRWGIISSVLAWVLATLVILPESMFYKPQMESQKYKCSISRPHFLPAEETFWKYFLTLKMNVLGFLFPLCVFVFCSVRMRRILRSGERGNGLHQLVFAIMAVFLLMWGPYNIALFLSTFKEYFSLHDCKSNYNLDISVQILRIFATTHCCVNPLLHTFLDTMFRRHLRRLCCVHDSSLLQSTEESARAAPREERDHSTKV